MRKGEINVAIGFVLINTVPAHEHEVYNKLSKVPAIPIMIFFLLMNLEI